MNSDFSKNTDQKRKEIFLTKLDEKQFEFSKTSGRSRKSSRLNRLGHGGIRAILSNLQNKNLQITKSPAKISRARKQIKILNFLAQEISGRSGSGGMGGAEYCKIGRNGYRPMKEDFKNLFGGNNVKYSKKDIENFIDEIKKNG